MDEQEQEQEQEQDWTVYWNQYLVAALLGLPNTDIDHILFESSSALLYQVPVDTMEEKKEEEEDENRITGQVHLLENREEDGRSSKRPHVEREQEQEQEQEQEPSIRIRKKIIGYCYLKLRSGTTFHFSEDDGKEIITTPTQEPNLYLRKLLSTIPRSIHGRLTFLSLFEKEEDNEVIEVDERESDEWITVGQETDSLATLFTNLKEQFYTAYLREMRMRRAFRTIVQRWRIYQIHKKECANTDPITLVEPVKPVIVYDMRCKTRYVYDATSLATWIESNLCYHEGGFAVPMNPRNPWTNTDFTYQQLVSIYYQLKEHGELRWGLTTLRANQFDKSRWQLFHRSALTMSAIRRSITQLDSTDARELLEDFIYAKMEDLHSYTTPSIQQAYHQAILHVPTHWYLEELKAVAYLHYETEHFGQNRHRLIHNRCDRIFRKQDQFIEEMRQMGIIPTQTI